MIAHVESRRSLAQITRIYALETKYEILKSLRLPAYSLPTILFPLVFYGLFGIALGQRSIGPTTMATYLIASYGAFGVIAASLFGFGVGVAVERGQGWMLFKRATPMPVGAYFAAKITVSVLFGVSIVVGLLALGSAFGGVDLPAATWLALVGVLAAGALPFCAFGLAIGSLVGPNSAPAVVNLIYMPASIVSGLWIPIHFLPEVLQRIAVAMPPYHLGQLALNVIGAGRGEPPLLSVAVLVAFTAVSLALARWGFRRDEGKTYG